MNRKKQKRVYLIVIGMLLFFGGYILVKQVLDTISEKVRVEEVMERSRYDYFKELNSLFDSDLLMEGGSVNYAAELLESATISDVLSIEHQVSELKKNQKAQNSDYGPIDKALALTKKRLKLRETVEVIKMDVPLISQQPELPTGCEITAVTMMLNYLGVKKDKIQLANELNKHDSDPYQGFVGDPFTEIGWTVYPNGLLDLIEVNAGSSQDLTGITLQELQKKLSQEVPVVVWMTMHGFTVHAITLVGFDSDSIFYHDPWTGERDLKMDTGIFMENWSTQGYKAVSI